jgi:hypothetical protein
MDASECFASQRHDSSGKASFTNRSTIRSGLVMHWHGVRMIVVQR